MFRLGRDEDTLTKQRQQIIEELNTKLHLLNLEVTLVFDSQYQLGESSRSHFRHLEILFSAYAETADNCILDEIKAENNPQQVVVVTSDKKLAWFARRCSAKTESVEHFMDWVNRRYKNKMRQLKEGVKTSKSTPAKAKVKEPPQPPKKPALPTAATSLDECYDFYLEQFQRRFEELPKRPPKKHPTLQDLPKKSKKKKTKENSAPQSDSSLDDMTRWLQIFERNLDSKSE